MMLKLAFPWRMREFIDFLKVQLPIEEFLEPFSDLLCNPYISKFQKNFKDGLNYF